jgi:hypothetical protein
MDYNYQIQHDLWMLWIQECVADAGGIYTDDDDAKGGNVVMVVHKGEGET